MKRKLADETKVKECRAKAGDGDGKLCEAGAWYQFGLLLRAGPRLSTSAARQPATQKGWQCLLTIS